jgi:HD-GYP domain-containing protein (c-di-GMP phosphodiesterase class II)
MILAEDIRHGPTGIILVPKGNVITEKMLKAINLFPAGERCLVYSKEIKGAPKKPEPEPEKKTINKERIDNLPEKISEQARKIYKDTFKTVKNLYESSQVFGNFNLHEANKAAESIADEVTRDPQVLLQIAFLKSIDNYTFSHAVHVSIYVTSLGKFLNLSKKELHDLSLAGLLHDIGKVDIPQEIVNKPGKLTDEEFNIMKEHVRFSFNRVYRFEGINRDILSAIGQHHERMDGSGYLQKLKSPYIHKWARLLSIADSYDALTTDRVYRKASLPHEGAEILMSDADKLDTEFLNVFIRNISFYPTGTQVILSSGEMGTVVGTQPNMPLRPIIKVASKDGKEGRIVNLVDNLTTFITQIIKD